jgi:hypothetical protein
MTPTDAQGAAPRCECGHERDKHSLRGGICLHRAPSGGWIECPCLAYRPPTAGPPPAPAAEPREDRPRCAECGWLTRWREDGVWACWTRACVKFDQPLSRPAAPSVPPDLRGLVDALIAGERSSATASHETIQTENECATARAALDAALAALVRRVEEAERDAERYRFLRDNPMGFSAVDGNASAGRLAHRDVVDRWTDEALAARTPAPSTETSDDRSL